MNECVFHRLCPWEGPSFVRELYKNTFIMIKWEHSGRSRNDVPWYWRSRDKLSWVGWHWASWQARQLVKSKWKYVCQQKKHGRSADRWDSKPKWIKEGKVLASCMKNRTSLYMESRSVQEMTDKSREVEFAFIHSIYSPLLPFCLTLLSCLALPPTPNIS